MASSTWMAKFSDRGASLSLRSGGGSRRFREATAFLVLAVLLGFAADARAEDECGPHEPGVEIVCSSANYDPSEGNIFYGYGAGDGDFTIRLREDLSVLYDRDAPGDDAYSFPGFPEFALPSGVLIGPEDGESIGREEVGNYRGDIFLYSSADVTSNGYGIWVGHYGLSGAVRMEISGGEITTPGDFVSAIHGRFHRGTGHVNLMVRNVTIETTGRSARGVDSAHLGTGAVNLAAQDLTITTAGWRAYGIFFLHTGAGAVNLGTQNLEVTTSGEFGHGVYAWHGGTGDVNFTVRGTAVATTGASAFGVYALHSGDAGDVNIEARELAVTTAGDSASGVRVDHGSEGDVNLAAEDLEVTTRGENSHGVSAWHRGMGDVNLDVRGGTAATMGAFAKGVDAMHSDVGHLNVAVQDLAVTTAGNFAHGVRAWRVGAGDLNLAARDLAVTTAGEEAFGVYAQHEGAGGVNVDVQDTDIATAGARASGIYGNHSAMEGDVAVRVRGGTVSTSGAGGYGVRGFQSGPGALDLDLRGTAVDTTGNGSHGAVILRAGSGSAGVAVEGGSIHAGGPGASGIQIGQLGEDGAAEWVSPVGEDGYRKHSVTVNAPVTGGSGENAAGVFLAGGGKVAIGPEGTLGSASRIAVLAAGGSPRLRVDMELGGRRVAEVIGDNSIINDGGKTTLVVNGVTLHEGSSGATGAVLPDGAWDLALSASEIVRGRSFSVADFTRWYAPRAAVYEALPGLLLRLQGPVRAGARLTTPGSPAWVRVDGGVGRYKAVEASAGASYDYRRVAVEAGVDVAMGPRFTGTLALRHVRGEGDVKSPSGGGEIAARGLGGALGLAWQSPRGHYFQGRFSAMSHHVDLASETRGMLAEDAGAWGHSLELETGRPFTVGERVTLAPRLWVTRSAVSFDVTDTLRLRVKTKDSDRLAAGAGVAAATGRVWANGTRELAVRGALDLSQILQGGTVLEVSGRDRLESVSDETRLLLSVRGLYRWDRLSVSIDGAVGGLGSRDREYAGLVSLGVRF